MARSKPFTDFRVGCFMTCDFAQGADGKLTIAGGGWNSITPSALPFPYRFYIALQITLELTLIKRLNWQVPIDFELLMPDGEPLGPGKLSAEVVIEKRTEDVPGLGQGIMIPVTVDATFVQIGIHRINLIIDGQQCAYTLIDVRSPETPRSTPIAPADE